MKLEENGTAWGQLKAEMQQLKDGDHSWRDGRVPLYIYYSDEEIRSVQNEAFSMYMIENGHGSRTVFPSVEKMENDVVSMCLGLFNAGPDAAGSFTSGGTESIFLSVKSARDWARAHKPNIKNPTLLLPQSAHPSFNKAAHYLGLDVKRVPLGETNRADVARMESLLGDDVVMIVGSAPAYPHGVFDPLGDLSDLALRHEVWLHVDACFGGFLSPFARELGYPIPDFDLSLPGVWSLSADLHKYGFAAKPASFVAYRDSSLMDYQGFSFDDWPRGPYFSPTFPGSRPAGAVAAAWAIMRHLGRSGYRNLANRTLRARDRLIAGANDVPGLRCLSPAELSIVVIESDTGLDMDAIAAGLNERHWFASRSVDPPGLHFTVNPVHEPIIDEYLADLRWAVETSHLRRGRVGSPASTY